MAEGLHTEAGQEPVEPPAPAALEQAEKRASSRADNLKKARAASAAAAKRKREAKAAREAKKAAAPAPTADQDPLQAMLEQPIASHEELAQVLANLEQTAGALAFGTRAEPIVSALDWSTPSGKPSQRCLMGAKMLWPWLVKTGGLAQLAEQSAEILAIVGIIVLTAPAIPPALSLVRELRTPPVPPAAEPVKPPPAPALEPNVHQMGAAA